ncbi:alpha/beta fold hydrolase [Kribbella sp. NPDC056951]|uniref:alpha/beta fold hydrolase n=1 Tax=Kribbella sp. NPDC056951 TaxID=3345978 RepID=UPI00363921B3
MPDQQGTHRRGDHPRRRSRAVTSVASDASAVRSLIRSVHGPVVLVGHSYGGQVITNAARNEPNVKAADVPQSKARLMAATQRPILESALKEASGDPARTKITRSWSRSRTRSRS